MFKEPSRHVYKWVALGLDFADRMIVIRIRKQPKNSVRIENWFCFMSLCDWSIKLMSLYQPIRFKTETSRDLVVRVFPRFKQFVYFFFEFSLVIRDIFRAVIGYSVCLVLWYSMEKRSIYLTNRYHVAVRLFSNRSQRTSRFGCNKKVTHKAQPSVPLLFLSLKEVSF